MLCTCCFLGAAWVYSFLPHLTPTPGRSGARGAHRVLVPWGPRWGLTVSLMLGPQILPQEEDYGFDIEEKNKAVVVKSVQRGSLAEVRLLRGVVALARAA